MSIDETLPVPADPSLPVIPGYHLVRLLSRSGLGSAYEARQLGLDRTVTLKIIRTENAREILRLRAHADAVAAVCHPNVVQIYEHAEHHGQTLLTLEHVPGGTLAEHLQDVGRLTGKPAATLVLGIARGLAAAHAQQLVHGDLKAANILLDADGEAKVADIELSALRDEGAPIGHPAHVAPELLTGAAKFIGPAVDVWSIGIILYHCVTGRHPFQYDDARSIIEAICTQTPESPTQLIRELPRDVEAVCLKCLAKNPAERYSSAAEVADELARFLADQPVLARDPGPIARVFRWSRVNRLAAALLVLAVAGLVAFVVLWQRADQNLAATKAALELEQNQVADLTTLRNETQRREDAERKRADDATTRFQAAERSVQELVSFTASALSLGSAANSSPVDAATRTMLIEALAACRRVATSPQGTSTMRVQLATAFVNTGNLFERQELFAEAAELYREAIEVVRPVVAGLADVRGPISQLGNVLVRRTATQPLAVALAHRGVVLPHLGKAAEAVPLLLEAEKLDREEMGAADPPDRPYWKANLFLHLEMRAEVYRKLGQRAEAARTLQEAKGVVLNTHQLRLLAGDFALLAAATEDAKEKAEYLMEAIETLRAAVAGGWRYPSERHYRPSTINNADFAAFREHPEVKKLLADAAKKP